MEPAACFFHGAAAHPRPMRDEHRIATRKRQGLVWLPHTPGWDGLLDTLSLSAELHGPRTWTVTRLEDSNGRLDFQSDDGTAVSDALESAATLASGRICHRCGAPGHTRGYGTMRTLSGLIPTRLETRCRRCHAAEAGAGPVDEEGPSTEREGARARQGLRWLPMYPGWEHLLDVLSETAEHHAPAAWRVEHVDEKMGHLRFAAKGRNEAMQAVEAFAAGLSAVTCALCGAPGQTRGYDAMPDPEGGPPTPSRRETRCDACHARHETRGRHP